MTGRGEYQARLGALAWVLTVQFLVVEAVVQGTWNQPYDRNTFYISDLGAVTCFDRPDGRAVCSPWHALMNTSFVLQGVLIIVGVALLQRYLPRGLLAVLAYCALIVGGLGVIVVGFAPEDTQNSVHYAGAAANFLGTNLGLVLLGLCLVYGRRVPLAGIWSGAAGTIGLICLGFFVAENYLGLGVGGIERVIAYTIPATLPVVAAVLAWSWRAKVRPSL